MIHLAHRGYDVAGFDPAEPALARARALLDPAHLLSLECGIYQDVARRGLPGVEQSAPYDAVLLGWGSMGHVHQPEERRALFHRLRELCPRGPVLFSWIREPSRGSGSERLRVLLATFGLARPSDQSWFRALVGFYTTISAAELESLAADTGYQIAEYGEEGPYALFRPVS